MKTYGQLNLQAIMEAENLDFAHWTYKPGQCSCCYGPLDQPAEFWRDGKKPRRRFLTEDKRIFEYRLRGEKFREETSTYLLFKNANNGSGPKKEDDIIQDYTCVSYQLNDEDQVKRICALLQEQLDEDYVVQVPRDEWQCIVIREKKRLENGY